MKHTLFLFVLGAMIQPQIARAEITLPTAASLEGRYQGQDPQGKFCTVTFVRHLNPFLLSVYDTKITSAEGAFVQFLNARLSAIDKKIKKDTEWRKDQDKNFSEDNISFNLYRAKGLPSPFGQPIDSLGANWYQGKLSMVYIELKNSYGPIVNPDDRSGMMCFGLQQVN